jgi:hypothetical protein
MLNLIIPQSLLHFIDNVRGTRSRASYLLKCVDFIKVNNIDINQTNNENNDDRTENTYKERQNVN